MIRALREEDLQAADAGEVADLVGRYSRWRANEDELAAAAAEIDRIRRLPSPVRAIIATYLGSDELFCHECGETSCVHGYPDF